VEVSGADPLQVEMDLKNEMVQKRIKEDVEEFNKFGFTGTPVVILNGVALEGAQRAEDLERALALTEMRN
jgi:predicted DsbA family dithiol-disulfide isomerase